VFSRSLLFFAGIHIATRARYPAIIAMVMIVTTKAASILPLNMAERKVMGCDRLSYLQSYLQSALIIG